MKNEPEYYLKDARNTVWGLAFIALMPAVVLVAIVLVGQGGDIKWDAITFGFMAASLALSTFTIFAGVKCGRGEKSGRLMAFVPATLLVLQFPLGTIFSAMVFVKLNKKEFVDLLR